MRPALRAGPGTAAPPSGPPQMGRRAVTIAWGLPIVVGCVWLGGWVLAAAALALAVVALLEFWALGRGFGVGPVLRWEAGAATAVVLAGSQFGTGWFDAALACGVTVVLAGGVVRAAATPGGAALRDTLAGTVWAILGVLYIPWLLGFVLLLRGGAPGPDGPWRAFGLIAFVWCGDVAAFLVGGRFGRHRLAVPISPGKSVEGALVAVAVAAALGALGAGPLGLPVWAAAPAAAVIGAAGLVGDLWESVLKRGAEVKDSGGGVPGHGGILDRFDSLLLGAPAAYWLLDRVPWGHVALLWR